MTGAFCHVAVVAPDQLPTFSPAELLEAQKSYACIGGVWHAVSLKKHASSILTRHPDMKVLKQGVAKVAY